MEGALILYLFVLFLAIFLGIELISKVPATLHTPLMSATNAIHGIVIVGTLLIAGTEVPALGSFLAFIAVVLGTLNVVGGFVVTGRMLNMFKKKGGR
jgi:NAD(P) transhydrogenase subunit alpha